MDRRRRAIRTGPSRFAGSPAPTESRPRSRHRDSFANGAAAAVVLSRSDGFADALAGTPLAIANGAPLLLTPSSSPLDPRVLGEIDRALGAGKIVYVLGGPSAVSPDVDSALVARGHAVTRLQGSDRYATAVAVAHDGLHDPPTQILATGLDFADALAGGTAAAHVGGGGAVLLTSGATMAGATSEYLAAHPGTRYALGGPAHEAAGPDVSAIVGADRFETSALVARQFFASPVTAGVASGLNFPDALSGGVHIARRGGPLVLVHAGVGAPTVVPQSVFTYLYDHRGSIGSAFVYGGTAVVTLQQQRAIRYAIAAS